jgi:low temperature requirement protein LtrA
MAPDLKSYVGYFALLWFTWLQVALFDIRFGYDSAFERVCKAVQFGVMVGLAVEGKFYDLYDPDQYSATPFRNISFILTGSRIVLMIQYGVTLFWLKGWKKARFPLLVHVGTMFTAAMIFLGLAFCFRDTPSTVHFVDGWYVTMAVEATVILCISGRTSFLNFRRTNIIERLGLLTLIILGEGIMSLGEQVNKINTADGKFGSDVIGLLVCCVLIMYFIYFLYFDQTETKGKKVGSFRQQLWTIGHFPLHAFILLLVAGLGQLTVWRRINNALNFLLFNVMWYYQPVDLDPATWQSYVNLVNKTLQENWPGGNYTADLATLGIPNVDPNNDTTFNAQWSIAGTVSAIVAKSYEVEMNHTSGSDAMDEIFNRYETVYVYFFCGGGLVLVSLACIFMLGKKDKTRVEYASAGVRLVVGSGLALLASMIIPWLLASSNSGFDSFEHFFFSPWLIPTVVLAYALGECLLAGDGVLTLSVVALDVVLIVLSRVLYKRMRHGSVGSIEKA